MTWYTVTEIIPPEHVYSAFTTSTPRAWFRVMRCVSIPKWPPHSGSTGLLTGSKHRRQFAPPLCVSMYVCADVIYEWRKWENVPECVGTSTCQSPEPKHSGAWLSNMTNTRNAREISATLPRRGLAVRQPRIRHSAAMRTFRHHSLMQLWAIRFRSRVLYNADTLIDARGLWSRTLMALTAVVTLAPLPEDGWRASYFSSVV